MNISSKNLRAAIVLASIVAIAGPCIAVAQEIQSVPAVPRPAAARQVNLDRNRDIRNETMKRAVPAATIRPSMISATRIEATAEVRRSPEWLNSGTTSPRTQNINTATLRSLKMTANKYATTTPPRGHEDGDKARLDLFAGIQTHLLTETQAALNNLKDIRTKIAAKIQLETQNGIDLTQATQLLSVADRKISAADTAIGAIAAIAPTFTATSSVSHIDPSTEVSLDGPRQIGEAAIQAITDARKALNDVILSIARATGSTRITATSTTQQ